MDLLRWSDQRKYTFTCETKQFMQIKNTISTNKCFYLDDEETASRAARAVTYTDQKPPIMSIDDGIKQGSFFPNPGDELKKGDAKGKLFYEPMWVNKVRNHIS